MLAIWAFDHIGNKYTLYYGENFMKKFGTSLSENATNGINFEKEKMLLLTKKSKITPRGDRMLHLWKKIS